LIPNCLSITLRGLGISQCNSHTPRKLSKHRLAIYTLNLAPFHHIASSISEKVDPLNSLFSFSGDSNPQQTTSARVFKFFK
jgi:hypothetical protein